MLQKVKNFVHFFQALAANIFYFFPYRGIVIIGVTGTDGKTTTASIIYHVLQKSGYKAAVVTSVCAIIDNKPEPVGYHVTTPRFFALRKLIKKARRAGAKYLVLEVTSHALDQHRVAGIPFQVGVVTNITGEHLDYHKTYENYVKAKAKLLKSARTTIINKDDKSYKLLKKILKNKSFQTYGFKNDSDINPHNFHFETKLIGRFNKYNCLAAIASLRSLGIPDSSIKKGISTFRSPTGRQELVYDNEYKIYIDFAHTPNSFLEILPELKKIKKNRLIHVFGAAGARDRYKRPIMGKISSDYSDIMILTAEDPRDESIADINNEIKKGISKNFKGKIIVIDDRHEAIDTAITMARSGDVIVLTGKGHESSMNYGRGEVHWSEHDAVQKALSRKK